MKKIAILASGSGTNAENIVRLFHEGNQIRVTIVLANREKAGVHARMQALGVPTQYIPNNVWEEDPQQIIDILQRNETDLVVLAGFMRKINPMIIRAYSGRIINIHPSLLPAYGGKGMWGHHVHEAVVAAGEKQSGVTVHYVTDEIDGGEIIMQQAIELEDGETPESLEAKIHPVEYDLYPRAIVAALKRLDTPPVYISEEESAFGTYAEPLQEDLKSEDEKTKNPDEEWSETLGIHYEPQSRTETPQIAPPSQQPQFQQPQPQFQSYRQNHNFNTPGEPMPPTYLVWSVVMTICCCLIPGVLAIIFSSQVSSKYHSGDIEGAKRASRMAEICIIVSFVLGLLWNTLQVPLLFAKELLLSALQ